MKRVMQQFEDRTTQRFHEYDEKMQSKRIQCKDKCDKEIQKIILKDKLEKELMDKFATLQTDIQSDAIPTCVCEKSVADKMEKGCLKCAQNLGGIVAPSSGVLAGIAEGALYVWRDAAIIAAKDAAIAKGLAAGKIAGEAAGVAEVIDLIESTFGVFTLDSQLLKTFFSATHYTNVTLISESIQTEYSSTCLLHGTGLSKPICRTVEALYLGPRNVLNRSLLQRSIKSAVNQIVTEATTVASETGEKATQEVTSAAIKTKTAAVNATYMGYQTPIIASIVAIVVIVLIMVIIYLILRYRRKKKMKKKLQYIKLLEE
ncbi:hypothetical protein PFNF135_00159 [Plasmodium falciparum NF135/5.C10]|uniref:Surface antigen n=1 Tax=Plasmodium falciparum NF135/5.C10 TaxID=1036726 RepID=W4IP98_PLAFA|nr:hypothetical protein PFNF135_00159 [Plasmodium falciparum NF135/5.C10]